MDDIEKMDKQDKNMGGTPEQLATGPYIQDSPQASFHVRSAWYWAATEAVCIPLQRPACSDDTAQTQQP